MITSNCKQFLVLIIPFLFLTSFANAQSKDGIPPTGIEADVFPYIFQSPYGNIFQIDSEITTYVELNNKLNYFAKFSSSDYPDAFNLITVDTTINITSSIFKVQAKLNNKNLFSYSYFLSKDSIKSDTAFFIIPENGEDISKVYFDNHLGTPAQVFTQHGDVFIYSKPNNDFRVIHSGGNRLQNFMLFTTIINQGGSYSATWFFEALATIKYLKSNYNKVILVGGDEGGYVATLLAIESNPTAAIIINGYSTQLDLPNYLTVNDFMIPNLHSLNNRQVIKNKISLSNTKFLFDYNPNFTNSRGVLYKNEYDYHTTQLFFGALSNVEFNYSTLLKNGNWNWYWDDILINNFINSL